MNRISKLTAAVLATAALLAGAPAGAGKKDDTLRWATALTITSGDPYYNSFREAVLIIGQMVWDTLVYRDPAGSEYKPLLASAWRWINPLTLELDLRRDVKFHDGRAFSADDVVYTLNYVTDPASKVNVPSNVNWIKRAEKTGTHQVRIHLIEPFPAALEYLSGPIAILPAGFYDDAGPSRLNIKLVGTGPYRFVKWEPGKEGRFELNRDYMTDGPKGRSTIGTIVFRTIPNVSVQIAELMSGGIDWLWQVPVDQAERLAKMPNLRVVAAETMRVVFLQFDVEGRGGKHPFTDLRVRQAVAHAIDRESIVKNLVGSGSRVWHTFCYESQVGCTTDVKQYEYSPQKAKALLTEAGYPNGFDAEIYGFRERRRIEALLGYLSASSIRARLNFMQYIAAREKLHKGEVQLMDTSWGSYALNDASAMINPWFTHLPDDVVRDPEIKAWADEAARSIDVGTRKALYAKVLKKIADNVYVLPLYTNPSNYAFTSDLAFQAWADENPRFFLAKWK